MNTQKFLKPAITIGVLAATVFGSAAYASSCGTSGGLDTTDVTFNGSSGSPNYADDCAGVFGGNINSLGDVNSPSVLFGPDPWEEFLQAEIGGGGTGADTLIGYMGFDWSLTANLGSPQGTGSWTLALIDDGDPSTPSVLPIYIDLMVTLKGANSWAAYLFDDETVNAGNSGEYTISFINGGGNNPDLSHMNLYLRDGRTTEPGCQVGDPQCAPGVPEPNQLALLGIGLLSMGAMRKFRM